MSRKCCPHLRRGHGEVLGMVDQMPQKTEDLPMKLVMFNNHLVESLVGGLEHGFDFPCHIWYIILPIDELIFFKMVIAPATR
jgi:hypothetical protein